MPRNATTAEAVPDTAPPPAPARHELVPIAQIAESPSNHRQRTWGDMDELAASIRAKGVLQPILVRPMKGIGSNLFEIVCGHRRFRAAQAAGLEAIPAMVRELSDADALEIGVIENLQRQDVHPLEEAEGYEELLAQKERPYTVDELAAKTGKSKAYIYGRLKLTALCPEARKAFYDGKLLASVALLVARIPSKELQKKALERLQPRAGGEDQDPVPFAYAADAIHREFMLKLAEAPFSIDDAALLPKAGACTACPKRSGANPELFADVAGADMCSDPTCYREKLDAHWEEVSAKAKASGQKVLPAKESKSVFADYGWDHPVAYSAPYVDLDQACDADPKRRSYRKLIGNAAQDVVVLGRDQSGRPRELVPKSNAKALLKKKGHDFTSPATSSRTKASSKDRAAAEKAKRQIEVDEAVRRRVIQRVVGALTANEPDLALWSVIVDELRLVDNEVCEALWPGEKNEPFDAVEKRCAGELEKLDADGLRGVALALALGPALFDPTDHRAAVLKWAGVDEKAIRASVERELVPLGHALSDEKDAPASDAKPPKAKAAKPYHRGPGLPKKKEPARA